ncbi:MAG: hypothetical protein U1E63_16745 [Burkholderiales bacterium]
MPEVKVLTAALVLTCAQAAFAAAPSLPGTVQADLKAMAAECTDAGGTAQTGNAVKRADLNGDGKEDYILDVGSIQCDGAASIYGDRDKSVTVYVGDGAGGARSAFNEWAYEAKLEGTGPATKLWLTVMGSNCGRKPAKDFASETFCDRPVVWNPKTQKFEFGSVSTVRLIQ